MIWREKEAWVLNEANGDRLVLTRLGGRGLKVLKQGVTKYGGGMNEDKVLGESRERRTEGLPLCEQDQQVPGHFLSSSKQSRDGVGVERGANCWPDLEMNCDGLTLQVRPFRSIRSRRIMAWELNGSVTDCDC